MNAALPLPPDVALALEETLPLASLRPGERAVVHAVDASSVLGRRLIDLGFRPGTPLRVMREAPLGDPISYALRGSRLCLRRSEALLIAVVRSPGE